MKTAFFRVLDVDDKATALLDAVHEARMSRYPRRFDVSLADLGHVPGSPFAYWVGARLRSLFKDLPPLEREGRIARAGGQTSDDARYLRGYWEIGSDSSAHWHTFLKGGRATKFHFDQVLVAPWDKARETFPGFLGRPGRASEKPSNCELYFRPGLTWPLRAGMLSPQTMPANSIFTVRSYAVIDELPNLLPLLALMASSTFDFMAKLLLGRFGFPEFVVGVLQKVPVPALSDEDRVVLGRLANRGWRLKRCLDTRTESSHSFALPALLQVAGADVATRAAAWSEHVRAVDAELASIQAEIDERCFALYGIDEADRRAITEGFGGNATEAESSGNADEAEDDAGEDGEEDDSAADAASLAAELVSWAVGITFGRFDVRLATGARLLPTEPEPFDPLPVCSPGRLTGDDAMPLTRPPTGYPLAFPETGVLVDDPGHARDVTATVRAVFDVVFGANADLWWHHVTALLDPKSHELRGWLAGGFFEHHLKRYSKSGRKAPIFWQFGAPSGSYSVWLYAHRLTRDSFFQIQNDVVGPKLTHEERQLASLMQNAGGSPSAPERKEIAAQETVVEELRAMLDEVKRVAPLWNPNLDDGVVLTMAPLWRLVPQHKPWQKELKSKWDELAAGKYDWAHLTMHLWPERVVPKCATDRSLAIAHGLEDVFWVEGPDEKWKPRSTPLTSVEELVRERSSPAVKAALKSLLDAPRPGGSSKRTRKGKTDARVSATRQA